VPSHLKEKQVPSILDTYNRGDYSDMLKSECFLRRYDRIFSEIPTDAPVIVELGVHSGGSLRLWRDTFPGATIIGFDAQAPARGLPSKCTLVQGSQGERADLERILAHADTIDIVIDDCSHLAEPTRLAFDTLFPHVRPGGFYVVEDWGTGYWPNWPDGELPQSSNHLAGMVGLVKQFVDVVGIPAINRLRDPPSIHEANWSTVNSPYEYVIYYPGIACVKKAISSGEPMHSPLARKDPSVDPRMIDDVALKHSPRV
jgi:SAM-dependent methyltransferase